MLTMNPITNFTCKRY